MLWAALFALLLVGGGPAQAGDEISEAERLVFMAEHFQNAPADLELHYHFHRSQAKAPDVDDEVTLHVRHSDERGRVVSADFLHGELHLDLPDVEHAQANPVILYFLEHDVRSMRQQLGGSENYFRKRLRIALAGAARLTPAEFEFAGARRAGTRVAVTPFKDDPNRERFLGLEVKRYEFTLSDQVPGGVFELRSVVEPADGAASPRSEEFLRLTGPGG